jgi:hypothetical protein
LPPLKTLNRTKYQNQYHKPCKGIIPNMFSIDQ